MARSPGRQGECRGCNALELVTALAATTGYHMRMVLKWSRLPQTIAGRSWLVLALLGLMCACGVGESSSSTAGTAVTSTEPTLAARVDTGKQAQRFERFRSQLEARLGHSSSGLEPHHPSSNVVRVPLERHFGHATAARRMPDGHLQYGCFGDAEPAARFLANSASEAQP
jgi:hypothetical protein